MDMLRDESTKQKEQDDVNTNSNATKYRKSQITKILHKK